MLFSYKPSKQAGEERNIVEPEFFVEHEIKPGTQGDLFSMTRNDRRSLMIYNFLVETYETERIKTLSVWAMFGMKICRFGRTKKTCVEEACTSSWCTSA